MNATIRTENGKIFVDLDERISREAFGAFRSAGWLWYRSENAFGFADNAEGAKRVRRLMNGSLADSYGLTDETKTEVRGFTFEYADEQTKKHFADALEQIDEQRKAEEAEKQRKAEQAAANNAADRQKLFEALRDLPNGWQAARSYGFMCPIMNTKEFFERGGLVKQMTVREACEQNGIEAPAETDDAGILDIKLEYCETYKNYHAQTDIIIRASVCRANGNGALIWKSGNFEVKIIIAEAIPRRTVKQLKDLAGDLGDDVIKSICLLYHNYICENGTKAVEASLFERIPGNGTISLEKLKEIAA